MPFAAKKEFLPGPFVRAGLVNPAESKETPQETFVAKTLPPSPVGYGETCLAEVLLTLCSLAQLAMGLQPYVQLSRLAQSQNASQQRGL